MIKTYKEAIDFVYQQIPKSSGLKFDGKTGLLRQKVLMNLLDNPQNKLKVIHVAGTSGKGSTSSFISQILEGQGFSTSLFISPHLIDIRERIQIRNTLITETDFIDVLNYIMPAIERAAKDKYGHPTFFEIITAMFYQYSYMKKVDYTVVETGLGGLFDGTNVVESKNKICVITKIGFDHTEILGNTLSKIATQKAGIIKKENKVFAHMPVKSVKNIFDKEVELNHAEITYINKSNYSNISLRKNNLVFDFSLNSIKISNLSIKSLAKYNVENCALALATVIETLNRSNKKLDIILLKNSLQNYEFDGRMQITKLKNQTKEFDVIFDGAHNPQKMKAFINSLKIILKGQKVNFLIGFKDGKDFTNMLKLVIPLAKQIIITGFSVDNSNGKFISVDTKKIAIYLDSVNFRNYEYANSPFEGFSKLENKNESFVVTGSLYLIGGLITELRAKNIIN